MSAPASVAGSLPPSITLLTHSQRHLTSVLDIMIVLKVMLILCSSLMVEAQDVVSAAEMDELRSAVVVNQLALSQQLQVLHQLHNFTRIAHTPCRDEGKTLIRIKWFLSTKLNVAPLLRTEKDLFVFPEHQDSRKDTALDSFRIFRSMYLGWFGF